MTSYEKVPMVMPGAAVVISLGTAILDWTTRIAQVRLENMQEDPARYQDRLRELSLMILADQLIAQTVS